MNAPTLISWNLTRRCNLACGHCYLDAGQRNDPTNDELSTTEAHRVIDELAEFAPGAMLVLTGGEPLLRPDLADLVHLAAILGLIPVIGSNGTSLTVAKAMELRRVGAAGVGISLDSATPDFHDRLRGVSGAWNKARHGMAAVRQAGLPLLIQATVFADNRDDLSRLVDLAMAEGAMAINFFFLVCTGRGVTQTDLSAEAYEATLDAIERLQAERPELIIRARCAPYARRRQKLRAGGERERFAEWSSACLAGRNYFRLTPEGQVTPCPYMPLTVGDLRQASLSELWKSAPVFQRLRNEMPQGKCGLCDYRLSCGGCRARAFAMTGDIMAEDSKCAYRPPPEALPEMPAAIVSVSAPRWHPEAEAVLARIPAFVRSRVRRRAEATAQAEGIVEITPERLHGLRPKGLGFLRRP